MRTRILLFGFILLAVLAVADVSTGWARLPFYALPIVLAVGLAGLVAAGRTAPRAALWLVLSGIVIASFAVHLAYSVYAGYESRHWSELAPRKAAGALGTVVSTFKGLLDDAALSATKVAGRADLARMLETGDRAGVFAEVAAAARALRSGGGLEGIAVRGRDGTLYAWAGDVPSLADPSGEWPPEVDVGLRGSTAYYWMEAHAAVPGLAGPAGGSGARPAFWVTVFKAVEARYPGVLPGAFAGTLEKDLARRVGHEVSVEFEDEAPGPAGGTVGERDDGEAAGGSGPAADLVLPDGSLVGRVSVRLRTLDEERALLTGRWLPVAALLVLVLVLVGAAILGRHLAGPRFSRVTTRGLVLILAVVWGSRLVLALLRDPLDLGRLAAFTPHDYATQIPMGVLRSPADLALTGAAAVLSLILVMAARSRVVWPGEAGRGESATGGARRFAVGFLAGALAFGAVLGAHFALGRVLLDTGANPFTISPFHIGASAILMKTGLAALSAAFVLAGAALVAWQIRALAAFWSGRTTPAAARRNARIFAIAMACALISLAAISGAGSEVAAPGAVTLAAGLAAHAIFLRRLASHAVTIVMALALGVALIQFPYGLNDLHAKQRESIEAAAAKVTARTDEWKVSVLDEALVQVGQDREIATALAAPQVSQPSQPSGRGRFDSEALRLWAGSILSDAHLACGIHILDRANREVGRFSLEDIGDLAEIESALRAARFASGPTTFVTRGTFGGRETDLYVGVAPFTAGETYLGSVVVSIPYFYNDLEWIAGLKPTFFEAIGGPPGRDDAFAEGYSASLVSAGRVTATTARDIPVGSLIDRLDDPAVPGWIQREVAGRTHAFWPVAFGPPGDFLVFSHRPLSASERAVYLMSVVLANLVIGFLVVSLIGCAAAARYAVRRSHGSAQAGFRWGFAAKLSLAFLVIAIVPALILGVASREFLDARLREVMESKAEESLNLAKLALERLVEGEAARLARNPILMDELRVEPSILGVLLTTDVAAAVADSSGRVLATFGQIAIPSDLVGSVTGQARPYDSFSDGDGLTATSAVPIRDVVHPDRIAGCVLVARRLDAALAARLASDLGRDITFYGRDRVEASSKQELFVAELMPVNMAADAYTACFLGGREVHFTWDRAGAVDVVIGYSPLRGFDGRPMGAISVPLVFRKDAVGKRMEWTSTAIGYLVAIVIASIFVMGLVLARRIARPIRELIAGTQRVAAGNFGFTIPRASDDEIGDLVTSFNRMTAKVQHSRSALQEETKYLETTISNVGAGIIIIDSRGMVHTINNMAERMLKVRAGKVGGKDARSVLRKIGAGSLAAVLDEVGQGRSIAGAEVTLPGEGGTVATLKAVASLISGPGRRTMGKVIVFEDVTELIRSKKLVAWSEMARQVAHEIKNPLTPMKLSAQQVLQAHRDQAGDFDRILEDSVATIIDQIESLRRIAVEFSQFSRMPERRLEPIPINDILEECLGQYERTVGGAVRISKRLDPSNPVVRVDRDEVKRVFLNLIENAMQAMPDGGSLDVRSGRSSEARRSQASARADQPGPGPDRQAGSVGGAGGGRPAYRIRVTSRSSGAGPLADFVEAGFTDTGVGISLANSQKLFEPNFSTKTQGTGLGLAISKGILDAYGGEIVIESTESAGTVVSVRFPAEETPDRQARPRRTGSRRRRRPRRG